jgi:NitT/TauT family transport system permease protein
MFENGVVRKLIVLGVLALLWEGYARWLDNPLLFPTFYDTLSALFASVQSGQLVRAVSFTLVLLLKGRSVDGVRKRHTHRRRSAGNPDRHV